jgi:DNA polymerase III alpha subunit
MELLLEDIQKSLHSTKVLPLLDRFTHSYPSDLEYKKRLFQELSIIEKKGFINCYLQVWDIISIIKRRQILWVLRGSAACSLVAYYMGIHDIDPLKENIPIERFLNWTREDQPDFDIDVPYNRREEILEDIGDMYPNMVSRISNRVMYQPKSALREAIRRLGYKKQLPKYFKLEKIFTSKEKQLECLKIAESLIGTQRLWSKHCGGLIIWKDGIPKELILKENQILMDKYDVERENLIKIDLLCNRGLAQLSELSDMKVSEYPQTDELTSNLLCSGDVLGLTQSESRTMRKTIIALQPKSMYDIALALALIRPAAADGGRKAKYLSNGKVDGIIYDEDALTFISSAVNCSLSQADKFRRGFANQDDKIISEFKKLCDSKLVLSELHHLRKYSFSKGHSIAYAQMVWALAYHKARNPKTFWEATLKHNQSSYRKWVHKREAIINGVTLQNKFESNNINQFIKTNWWDGKDFLPGMGIEEKDGKIWFRGIVSNYRKLKRWGKTCVLMSIGIDNGKHIDLIFGNKNKYPFGYYWIVEGFGIEKENFGSKFIEVENFNCSNFKESKEYQISKCFW